MPKSVSVGVAIGRTKHRERLGRLEKRKGNQESARSTGAADEKARIPNHAKARE